MHLWAFQEPEGCSWKKTGLFHGEENQAVDFTVIMHIIIFDGYRMVYISLVTLALAIQKHTHTHLRQAGGGHDYPLSKGTNPNSHSTTFTDFTAMRVAWNWPPTLLVLVLENPCAQPSQGRACAVQTRAVPKGNLNELPRVGHCQRLLSTGPRCHAGKMLEVRNDG